MDILGALDVAMISIIFSFLFVDLVDTAGTFINEDGFLSETTMKIQDSLYYQDFSYVIKVGRAIGDWRNSFKSTMHTAGFYFTGQVDMATQVNNQIRSFTGVNSGLVFDPGADLVINTLFSTIFGRRLGTVDDGTSLRSNPQLGVDPDFDDSNLFDYNEAGEVIGGILDPDLYSTIDPETNERVFLNPDIPELLSRVPRGQRAKSQEQHYGRTIAIGFRFAF